MAMEIGIITILTGTAIAVADDGSQRALHVGDKVFSNEIISTGVTAGAVEIEFADGSVMDLGRGSQVILDNEVFDPQQVIQTSEKVEDDVDVLQQALLDGLDPTQVGEATAVGSTAEFEGDGGTTTVQILHNEQRVTPTTGFVTTNTAAVVAPISDRLEDEIINLPPVVTAEVIGSDDVRVFEDDSIVTGIIEATDPDGGPLTFTLLDAAPAGLIFNADGSYSFDPSHDAYQSLAEGEVLAPIALGVRVTDPLGAFVDTTLTINITGTNDAPILTISNITATEDGATITGTPSFTDVDSGDTHTYTISTMAVGEGSVSINSSTGVYSYNVGSDFQSLALNATTTVNFDVTVTDNNGGFDTETVTVTIKGTNDAPVISDTSNITGTLFNGLNAEYYALSGNDISDLTEFRSIIAGNDPTATFRATNIDYSWDGSHQDIARGENLQTFLGEDAQTLSEDPGEDADGGLHLVGQVYLAAGNYEFEVRADDGYQIMIDGNSVAEYANNQGPTTRYHTFTIDNDGYHDIDMAWWDRGGAYVFQPALSSDDGVTYKTFSTANFDFRAVAPVSVIEAGTTDSGAVVDGINVVTGQMVASDVDTGAVLTWSVNSPSTTYGIFGIDTNSGEWTFTLDNALSATQGLVEDQVVTETFSVIVTDEHGATDTEMVTIKIQGTNDAPALRIVDISATEDGATVTGTPNFTDVDTGDTHTYTVSTMGTGEGSVSINASNGEYTYNPGSDFQSLALNATTTVSFDVTVTDSNGGFDTETVTVTITGTNDAPISEDFTLDVSTTSPINIDFGPYVSDIEDDLDASKNTLVKITDLPDNGTLVDASNSSVVTGTTYNLADLTYIPSASITTNIFIGSKTANADVADWNRNYDDITVTTTTGDGAPLKAYNFGGNKGTGIGDNDGGGGIDTGETITVSFGSEVIKSATIGLDGLGNHFNPGVVQDAKATWIAMKGSIVVGTGEIQSFPEEVEFIISIDEGFDSLVFGTTSTDSHSDYVIQYIQAELTDTDSFTYIPVDSDGLTGTESTVSINITGDARSGDNQIYGGTGNDVLVGGAGDDILTGGDGNDIFVWHQEDVGTISLPAHDIVMDFEGNISSSTATTEDVLDLSDLLSGGTNGIEGVEHDGHLQLKIGTIDGSGQVANPVQTIDLSNITVSVGDNTAVMLDNLLANGGINDGM